MNPHDPDARTQRFAKPDFTFPEPVGSTPESVGLAEAGSIHIEGVGCVYRPKLTLKLQPNARGVGVSEVYFFEGRPMAFDISLERWSQWLTDLHQELARKPVGQKSKEQMGQQGPDDTLEEEVQFITTAGVGRVELRLPCKGGTIRYYESGGKTDRPKRVASLVMSLFGENGFELDPNLLPVGPQ